MVKYFLEEARERICSPPARSVLSPPPDPPLQGPPRAASRGRPGPRLLEPSLPPVSSTSPPKPPVLESKLSDSTEPVALTRLCKILCRYPGTALEWKRVLPASVPRRGIFQTSFLFPTPVPGPTQEWVRRGNPRVRGRRTARPHIYPQGPPTAL